jgi:arsenate reductase (thioredoxin)
MHAKPKVLFFSTGDATRSQMAEGFLKRFAGEELIGVSTAVKSPNADPLTNEVMSEVGVDISQQHAKPLADSLREHFAYVITVSDASHERHPVWPFTRNIIHWSLADPELVKGSAEQKRDVFRRVRDETARRVREFVQQVGPQLRPERERG